MSRGQRNIFISAAAGIRAEWALVCKHPRMHKRARIDNQIAWNLMTAWYSLFNFKNRNRIRGIEAFDKYLSSSKLQIANTRSELKMATRTQSMLTGRTISESAFASAITFRSSAAISRMTQVPSFCEMTLPLPLLLYFENDFYIQNEITLRNSLRKTGVVMMSTREWITEWKAMRTFAMSMIGTESRL